MTPTPTKRLATLVLAAAACAPVATGCSRDGATPASTTSTSTVPAAGAGTTATAARGTDGDTSPAGSMRLSAAEFTDGGQIPKAQVCTNQGGNNEGPTLTWSGVPEPTAALVLVMHDPDAPLDGGFTHWITRLDPRDGTFKPEPVPGARPPDAYFGPCPPPGAPHRYVFTLYAFGPDASIPDKPTKADLDRLAPEALATATLTGVYANPG